jgi:antitoxin ParD1/3/4
MQTVVQLNIAVPADIAQLIRDKVAAGTYASSSDVVTAALRALQSQESYHSDRLAGIRAKIAQADADPRASLTDAEVDAHFAARRRAIKAQGDNA